jgi:nucleoside-diphosphate-sugar epimerase
MLDISRIKALGWEPRTGLAEGVAAVYDWYLRTLAGSGEMEGQKD